MFYDQQALDEARALLAYIRTTHDPEEQNRLWNRYYRLSDQVFPEAAALHEGYRSLQGAERARAKSAYIEAVRRMWEEVDGGLAAPAAGSGTPPPLPRRPTTPPGGRNGKRRAGGNRAFRGWAAGAGVLAVTIGGAIGAWHFAADRGASDAGLVASAPVAGNEVPADDAPSKLDQAAATPILVPIDEIEAQLAQEIQPAFTPVPADLKGRGDRVTAGGKVFEDVYVMESDALYYVRVPGEGAVESVPRDGSEVVKSGDLQAREALLALWKQNRAAIEDAEKARAEEKKVRIAAYRAEMDQEFEARKKAQEAAGWRVKEQEWVALSADQRHGLRVQAYSNWQTIQTDVDEVEELYLRISRAYEYIGITDSRMGRLSQAYRKESRERGPDFEVEDAFLVYGWSREKVVKELETWEAEYYKLYQYVSETYPEYEARVEEIKQLDASLPEPIRVAEATVNWDAGPEAVGEEGAGGSGTGTGFIVARGHVMTCDHVVRGGNVIRVISTRGVSHNAKVLASDSANDWALLEVEGLAGEAIPLSPQVPNVGATIYCLGYPLGGIKGSADPIVGSGNVAALQRIDGDDRFIQITAPINPGNSGGPVLDQQGRWVGIVSQKLNDLRRLQESQTVAQGLNFAVKATFIQPLLAPRTSVRLEGDSGGGGAVSLEEITKKLSPSIVKIEVE